MRSHRSGAVVSSNRLSRSRLRDKGRSWAVRAALGALVIAFSSSTVVADAQPAKPQPGKGAPAKPKTKKQLEEEAGKLFQEGKTKFDAGDYQGAYEAFKAADELVPASVPKFRMAESLDKKGDIEGAITAYESFLASDPRPVEDKQRIEVANARVTALKATPADVKVAIMPPEAAAATLSVDGAPAAGNPVKVPPGVHTISATLEGFEDAKIEVDVKRGEQKEVTLTLVPKPVEGPGPDKPPPPPPAETSSGSSLIPAIVTLSLAGAGVVVGAVFGGLALKSKSEFEDTPTQDLFDETERNALIADMSFGVALTFGVTGVVLLLTDSGGSETAAEGEKKAKLDFILPYASPDGAGAVGRISF